MRQEGYRVEFAAAITAVSSTVGPIIPPSIHLVIYGAIAEVSVADLFMAGILPGILMGLALMVTIYIMAVTGLEKCPTRQRQTLAQVGKALVRASFSLLAPLIILGGILVGVVTPTEAGVIAVMYTLFLGLMYRTPDQGRPDTGHEKHGTLHGRGHVSFGHLQGLCLAHHPG